MVDDRMGVSGLFLVLAHPGSPGQRVVIQLLLLLLLSRFTNAFIAVSQSQLTATSSADHSLCKPPSQSLLALYVVQCGRLSWLSVSF